MEQQGLQSHGPPGGQSCPAPTAAGSLSLAELLFCPWVTGRNELQLTESPVRMGSVYGAERRPLHVAFSPWRRGGCGHGEGLAGVLWVHVGEATPAAGPSSSLTLNSDGACIGRLAHTFVLDFGSLFFFFFLKQLYGVQFTHLKCAVQCFCGVSAGLCSPLYNVTLEHLSQK